MKIELKNRIFSFKQVLIAALVVATLLPVVIIAPISIISMYDAVVDNTKQQLLSELATVEERLRGNHALALSRLAAAATEDDVITAAGNPLFAEPAQRVLDKITSDLSFISGISLFSSNGSSALSVPNSAPAVRLDWNKYSSLNQWKLIREVGDNGEAVYRYAVPVFDKVEGKSTRAGLLVAELNIGAFVSYRIEDIRRKESTLKFSTNGKIVAVLGNDHFSDAIFTSEKSLAVTDLLKFEAVLSDDANSKLRPARIVAYGLVALAIASVTLSSMFAIVLSRRLSKPLRNLHDVAEQYGIGDFRRSPQKSCIRDFNKLGHAFSFMIERISQQIEHLNVVIKHLEILAVENRNISSKNSYSALATQISDSVSKFFGQGTICELYLEKSILSDSLLADEYQDPVAVEAGTAVAGQFETSQQRPVEKLLIERPSDKSILGVVLINRVISEEQEKELRPLFASLSLSIASVIENVQYLQRQKEQIRMHAELETAKLVQRHLLPSGNYEKVLGYEISGYNKAATECGGDWWHYHPLRDGRLLVLLGDVTGHGIPSALVTAVVKGFCDSLHRRESLTVSDLLADLHSEVRLSNDGTRTMTMFAAILNPADQTITFANAAHPRPFHIATRDDGRGRTVRGLLASGCSLGFGTTEEARETYFEKTVPFVSGDVLFVFSDGLYECENLEGRPFGEKRLRTLLDEVKDGSVVTIRDKIIQCSDEFFGGAVQNDDVTFFALRFQPS